jgi:pimeloyl-ACP methyl ester carboxylesterase
MKIIVDDIAVEYAEDGRGRTVLLLHGWGDTHSTFDFLEQCLGSGFRFISLDLPGFGASEQLSEAWNVADYAKFIQDFCQKLEVKPNIIIGHSFGGRVAIKSIAENMIVPDRLVLMGSAGIAKNTTFRNSLITVITKIFAFVTYIPPIIFYRDQLRKWLYRSIGSDYLDAGKMKETYLNVIKEDLQADAAKIKVPTLLIWGEKDTATPIADGEKLANIISDGHLKVIGGASHFVHLEQPAKVASLIKDFLK